jgi:hypothetical protein
VLALILEKPDSRGFELHLFGWMAKLDPVASNARIVQWNTTLHLFMIRATVIYVNVSFPPTTIEETRRWRCVEVVRTDLYCQATGSLIRRAHRNILKLSGILNFHDSEPDDYRQHIPFPTSRH